MLGNCRQSALDNFNVTDVVCYLQVLANVAATSIPQLPGQQQMVAMQSQDGTQQMVSVARGQPSTSLSGVQVPATQQEAQSDGQNMVLGQTATNPFQTVTIVPSEVNQGGEVRVYSLRPRTEAKTKMIKEGNDKHGITRKHSSRMCRSSLPQPPDTPTERHGTRDTLPYPPDRKTAVKTLPSCNFVGGR